MPPEGLAGDNDSMIRARHDFLSKGYYASLMQMITDIVKELACQNNCQKLVYIDSGCGDGYYTKGIYDGLLEYGIAPRAAAFDISKPAVKTAAKRNCRNIDFVVASAYRMPLKTAVRILFLLFFLRCARAK